jgi:hypothetical protein
MDVVANPRCQLKTTLPPIIWVGILNTLYNPLQTGNAIGVAYASSPLQLCSQYVIAYALGKNLLHSVPVKSSFSPL